MADPFSLNQTLGEEIENFVQRCYPGYFNSWNFFVAWVNFLINYNILTAISQPWTAVVRGRCDSLHSHGFYFFKTSSTLLHNFLFTSVLLSINKRDCSDHCNLPIGWRQEKVYFGELRNCLPASMSHYRTPGHSSRRGLYWSVRLMAYFRATSGYTNYLVWKACWRSFGDERLVSQNISFPLMSSTKLWDPRSQGTPPKYKRKLGWYAQS